MKFDTKFIDLSEVRLVEQSDTSIFISIKPIKYTDHRNPRLPRKSSKQTNLQIDSNYLFEYLFKDVEAFFSAEVRFSVDLKIFKGNDRLGGGDLDNYCKAILDAITLTEKVWKDDKQVDEISIKRNVSTSFISYIDLIIAKI
jgi:Endodeoxyribonuclease RusA